MEPVKLKSGSILEHEDGRGIRLDIDENVWVCAGDGVHCDAAMGELLGKIVVPEPVANICFCGPKFNRLFITASSSLYNVYPNTRAVGLK